VRRNRRQAVLVCVTNQYSCERLVRAGMSLAQREGFELRVLCIQHPEYASNSYLTEIEHLFAVSRKAGGEMIVYYREDPVRAAVTYIRTNRIAHIVLGGVPDVTRSAFISGVRAQCAQIPMSIVNGSGDLVRVVAGVNRVGVMA